MKREYELYTTPAVYRGKSYVTRECLTGRLCFPSSSTPLCAQGGAQIAVLDEESARHFLASDDAPSASAVIFIGEHPPQALCTFAVLHALPLLILARLSPAHDGKIALLDSRTATLFVDPDLDTLARYARHLRGASDGVWHALSPILCAAHRALPLATSLFPAQTHLLTPVAGETLWTAESEDEIFEALRALAEESVGTPLILPIGTYGLHEAGEGFSPFEARLCAMLRAAVYGRFTLLFEGLCCAEDVRAAFAALDHAAASLAEKRREFVRPRACGLAVESLLLLHELDACPPVSFLCLDWDRLLRTALPPYAGKLPPREAKVAFLHMIEKLLHPLQVPICARTVHAPATHVWTPADATRCEIDTFFVPAEHLSLWQEWIEGGKI